MDTELLYSCGALHQVWYLCFSLTSTTSSKTRLLLVRSILYVIWKTLCLPLANQQPRRVYQELPLQGLLHLLVAEALDDGAEHGGYDGAADRHHRATGISGSTRLDVGEITVL